LGQNNHLCKLAMDQENLIFYLETGLKVAQIPKVCISFGRYMYIEFVLFIEFRCIFSLNWLCRELLIVYRWMSYCISYSFWDKFDWKGTTSAKFLNVNFLLFFIFWCIVLENAHLYKLSISYKHLKKHYMLTGNKIKLKVLKNEH